MPPTLGWSSRSANESTAPLVCGEYTFQLSRSVTALLNVIFTTGSPFSAVGMGEMLPLRTAVAWPAAPQHELSVRLANL